MKALLRNFIQALGLVLFIAIYISVLGLSSSLTSHKAAALNGSDFNPGHILDDVIFTNNIDLSSPSIQTFLNSQMPDCDVNGTQSITYYFNPNNGQVSLSSFSGGSQTTTSRATYGQHYDWYNKTNVAAAPYVCLANYVETPSTGANNLQNPSLAVSGGESAAQIIYFAAQQYQINPEVIITTLQKEQALVTDDWPWTNEFTEAMGFNCPDSSGCSGYTGFYQQVNAAAAQYRNYLNNPNNFNSVVGSDRVAYSPSCGGPTINIQNQATAALYDYTPYQPDSNVLNSTNPTGSGNGPGNTVSGDGCAAYGNRNFWWYFNTWFGSTYANGYQAQFFAQSPLNQPFYLGESKAVYISYKNIGSAPWYDDSSVTPGINPVHLAASVPTNRSSVFSYGWPSAGRPDFNFSKVYESDGTPLASNQHIVQPGQIAEFDFNITAPWNINYGAYTEYFQPVLEHAQNWSIGGVSWLNVIVHP